MATYKCGAARDLPIVSGGSWDGPAAQKRLFGDGEAIDEERARRGHLIYDADAPDLRGSYKLPFTDVVNGRLVAVAAGLRAAASRLPQTDAPQAVRDRARGVLDGYFEKLNENAQIVNCFITAAGRLPRRTLDGRLYAVAPVVAMVAGVRNGALLPVEDLATFVAAWDGRPVALRHPQENGWFVTANSPDIIEQQVLGQFFNVLMDQDALKGELWLDEGKIQRLGGDALEVLQRLDAGRPLEVSVAYWADVEPGEGMYQGEPYVGVQRNLRPDHIALLPDELGACSWADGCGAPRVNERTGAVCRCQERNMEEENKEVEMVVNEEASVGETEATPAAEASVEAAAAPDLSELNELAQFVRDFGGVAALKDALHAVTANVKATKCDLVTRLVANQQCAFSKADLEAMTVEALQKLDRSLRPADYSGRGGVRPQPVAEDDGWAPYKA